MMLSRPPFFRPLATAVLIGIGTSCLHGATATQSFNLRPGWNSIWLNVDPVERADDGTFENQLVDEVFTSPAITVVATPYKPVAHAEFVGSPAEAQISNRDEWRVWRRNGTFGLNSLEVIRAHTPYLVYSDSGAPVTLNITGNAYYKTPEWSPNQYNLVGFGVTGSPSFASFFSAAAGRLPVQRIFRLQADGNWSSVLAGETVESEVAYWIYCEGKSAFAGPIRVGFPGLKSIDFGVGSRFASIGDTTGAVDPIEVSLEELVLSNIGSESVDFGLTRIASGAGAPAEDALRIFEVEPKPTELGWDTLRQVAGSPIGTLPVSSTEVLTLAAYRNWSTGNPDREQLFRLELGNIWYWLPMRATNPSLSLSGADTPSTSAFTGLWSGTVILDQVTSFQESRLRPTTTALPLKMLVHVDDTGQARLLQHATVMQRKGADDSEGAQVILVNDEFLPQVEGVIERGGNKVGMRLETVDYDLPRDYDPGNYELTDPADAAFLQLVAGGPGFEPAAVTADDIRTYVDAQASRPVALKEAYFTSWDLSGGIGPGQALGTGPNPLTLDPFHRSNPFRHAYHSDHTAGYAITRSLEIVFTDVIAEGLIKGRYTETLSGLAARDIRTSGSVEFTRLVDTPVLK